jgi:hypothetical protein
VLEVLNRGEGGPANMEYTNIPKMKIVDAEGVSSIHKFWEFAPSWEVRAHKRSDSVNAWCFFSSWILRRESLKIDQSLYTSTGTSLNIVIIQE